MKRRRRATWTNHTGNQSCQPLEVCVPESVEDLVTAVTLAEREGVHVRAVGSGHSWSDVALTGGLLLQPHGLARPLELDRSALRDPHAEHLVRVEGGMRIRELNEHLWDSGRALPNMGGYDGQTIAGVISTSTHGSGLHFGPLSDLVRSVDMVASGGRQLRIEPHDGPTDPSAASDLRDGWALVQCDDLFDAAVVGMGCLGVIYAVTLEVRDAFALTESRRVTTWEDVLPRLSARETLRESHWELLLNPYAGADGRHTCVVTSRAPAEPGYRPTGADRRRPWVNELLASLPVTHGVMNLVLDLDPDGIPDAMDDALERLADREFTDRSYRVFNIGAANLLPAYSSEIAVPLSGDIPARAIQRVFDVADRHRRLGDVYATAPVALRFVRGSRAFLSMMHGRDTMVIELIMQKDTEGGFELLAAYEEELRAVGGRPHWGQVNAVTGRELRAHYPALDAWRRAREELNASGVFDGPFSARVGLS